MTDDQIKQLIEKTLEFEGGYSNDPDDPGGETKWGISKRAFPDLDIKNLTKEQAIAIYREKYLQPVVSFVHDVTVPDGVVWKLFDIAVNMGLGTAEAFWSKVNHAIIFSWAQVLHELSAMQMKRYALIIKAKPSQVKYLSGWVNRAMTV